MEYVNRFLEFCEFSSDFFMNPMFLYIGIIFIVIGCFRFVLGLTRRKRFYRSII